MQLIRSEVAYIDALGAFIHRQIDAPDFLLRFFRLWHGDDASAPTGHRAVEAGSGNQAGLCAALDGINTLCEFYVRSRATEHGFSISEERLRKEIEGLAWMQWPALRSSPPGSMREQRAAG
jgi:hypothetical protein